MTLKNPRNRQRYYFCQVCYKSGKGKRAWHPFRDSRPKGYDEQALLTIIHESSGATFYEIDQKLNWPKGKAKKIATKLEARGRIRLVPDERNHRKIIRVFEIGKLQKKYPQLSQNAILFIDLFNKAVQFGGKLGPDDLPLSTIMLSSAEAIPTRRNLVSFFQKATEYFTGEYMTKKSATKLFDALRDAGILVPTILKWHGRTVFSYTGAQIQIPSKDPGFPCEECGGIVRNYFCESCGLIQ
jgi:DNA-binding MarR family transcriptional regulator